MDQLKTTCASCGRMLRMLAKHVGRKVNCPCGAILRVPSVEDVTAALPERYACEPVIVDGLQVIHPTSDSQSRRLQRTTFEDSVVIRRLAKEYDERSESTDGED